MPCLLRCRGACLLQTRGSGLKHGPRHGTSISSRDPVFREGHGLGVPPTHTPPSAPCLCRPPAPRPGGWTTSEAAGHRGPGEPPRSARCGCPSSGVPASTMKGTRPQALPARCRGWGATGAQRVGGERSAPCLRTPPSLAASPHAAQGPRGERGWHRPSPADRRQAPRAPSVPEPGGAQPAGRASGCPNSAPTALRGRPSHGDTWDWHCDASPLPLLTAATKP